MKNFFIIGRVVYEKTPQGKMREVCTLQDSGELMSVYANDVFETTKRYKVHRLLFVRLPQQYGAKFLVFLTGVGRNLLEDNLTAVQIGSESSMAEECWLASKIEILEDCVRITMLGGTPVSFVENGGVIVII